MRVATDPSDPGYSTWSQSRKRVTIKIYCDGKSLRDCLMVDTKRRVAVVADRDSQGNITLTARGDKVKRKQISGDIRIEFGPSTG